MPSGYLPIEYFNAAMNLERGADALASGIGAIGKGIGTRANPQARAYRQLMGHLENWVDPNTGMLTKGAPGWVQKQYQQMVQERGGIPLYLDEEGNVQMSFTGGPGTQVFQPGYDAQSVKEALGRNIQPLTLREVETMRPPMTPPTLSMLERDMRANQAFRSPFPSIGGTAQLSPGSPQDFDPYRLQSQYRGTEQLSPGSPSDFDVYRLLSRSPRIMEALTFESGGQVPRLGEDKVDMEPPGGVIGTGTRPTTGEQIAEWIRQRKSARQQLPGMKEMQFMFEDYNNLVRLGKVRPGMFEQWAVANYSPRPGFRGYNFTPEVLQEWGRYQYQNKLQPARSTRPAINYGPDPFATNVLGPKPPWQYAEGGQVPAILHEGEAVLNRNATEMFGRDNVAKLNVAGGADPMGQLAQLLHAERSLKRSYARGTPDVQPPDEPLLPRIPVAPVPVAPTRQLQLGPVDNPVNGSDIYPFDPGPTLSPDAQADAVRQRQGDIAQGVQIGIEIVKRMLESKGIGAGISGPAEQGGGGGGSTPWQQPGPELPQPSPNQPPAPLAEMPIISEALTRGAMPGVTPDLPIPSAPVESLPQVENIPVGQAAAAQPPMRNVTPSMRMRQPGSQLPIDWNRLKQMDPMSAQAYLQEVAATQGFRPSLFRAMEGKTMGPQQELFGQLQGQYQAALTGASTEASTRATEEGILGTRATTEATKAGTQHTISLTDINKKIAFAKDFENALLSKRLTPDNIDKLVASDMLRLAVDDANYKTLQDLTIAAKGAENKETAARTMLHYAQADYYTKTAAALVGAAGALTKDNAQTANYLSEVQHRAFSELTSYVNMIQEQWAKDPSNKALSKMLALGELKMYLWTHPGELAADPKLLAEKFPASIGRRLLGGTKAEMLTPDEISGVQAEMNLLGLGSMSSSTALGTVSGGQASGDGMSYEEKARLLVDLITGAMNEGPAGSP
jgi:hypothetical protein